MDVYIYHVCGHCNNYLCGHSCQTTQSVLQTECLHKQTEAKDSICECIYIASVTNITDLNTIHYTCS